MDIQHFYNTSTAHNQLNFWIKRKKTKMARKNKDKKTLLSTRFISAIKTSTGGHCGLDQTPGHILETRMDRNSINVNSHTGTRRWCTCGNRCLGPLAFHSEVKGKHVQLSADDRRATRNTRTFRHGVTFSSRPIRVGEKVRVRVERCVEGWHGALRVGFTSVPPGSGPMSSLAIPDLTDRQGFWAHPVPENHIYPGTELTFWVTHKASLHIQTHDGFQYEGQMCQMDTRKPIWAMIDVYGQTSSVLLLGSEKKTLLNTRHSCSAPEIPVTEENCGYDRIHEQNEEMLHRNSLDVESSCQSKEDNEDTCIVCYSEAASVYLDCGHNCLCSLCAVRIISDFGTCPLCRQNIR